MKLRQFKVAITNCLRSSRDLLKKGQPPGAHCYVASEALYHLIGGKGAGFKPMNIKHEGASHWFLRGPGGIIIDLTVDQFITIPNYSTARGRGFMTRGPSKRATILMGRVCRQIEWDEKQKRLGKRRLLKKTCPK